MSKVSHWKNRGPIHKTSAKLHSIIQEREKMEYHDPSQVRIQRLLSKQQLMIFDGKSQAFLRQQK